MATKTQIHCPLKPTSSKPKPKSSNSKPKPTSSNPKPKPRSSNSKPRSSNSIDSSLTVMTTYRILCHDMKADGVIGKSGSIIKSIRQHIDAWINVHELMSGDEERIIKREGEEGLCSSVR